MLSSPHQRRIYSNGQDLPRYFNGEVLQSPHAAPDPTRLAPKHTYLLTVRGRQTGKLYSTPVSLVEEGANRWLVSPYGEVNWVRNARAAKQVTLTRGRRSETVAIVELGPQESAPVLQKYIKQEPITQPYFDVQPEASREAFEAEAAQHPVFLIQGSV